MSITSVEREMLKHEDTKQLHPQLEYRKLEEPRNQVPRKNKRKSRKFSNFDSENKIL